VVDQLKSPEQFMAKVAYLYSAPEESSSDVLEFKDGRVFERYSQPQKIADQTIGRVWSFRDVTERRHLEEHLRQAQKMEAIGRLAGGIAHDFNNLLMIMMGHCREFANQDADRQILRYSAEQIMQAAERAASLTKQLLAFSRRQVLAPQVLGVNSLLTGLSTMLRRLIGEDIDLSVTFAESEVYVEADPGQLEQVIVNLVVNARDAMPGGGRLLLGAQSVELAETRSRGTAFVPRGAYVLLTVSDTGMGLDQHTLPRIFEPFFTTKEPGKGTGLGLSTAYGIIRQSKGYILVESESGSGTTFEIYLPRVGTPCATITPEQQSPQPYRGSETILIVEDEDGIRLLTRTFLEQQGYTVLEASNGEDAFQIAKSYSMRIHLLLTDVVMPGIRGTELAQRLLSDRPDLRVLFVSGYPEEGIADPSTAVLQKPFPMHELGARIREILDKTRASAA